MYAIHAVIPFGRARESMGITSSSAVRCLLSVACFALALGCGGPGGDVRSVVFRFIDDEPQTQFDRTFMVSTDTVARWEFRTGRDLESWEIDLGSGEMSVVDGVGLALRPKRQFLTMARNVDLDAAEVDALEIRVKGLPRHPVTLEWAGPGESYSSDRKITLEQGRGTPGGFLDHRIVTAGHPKWRGAITRVRFGLALPKAKRATVEHIVALSESVSEESLAAAIARPWKMNLDNDVRNGMLARPGQPIRSRVTVPAEAALWLSYGLQPRVAESVRFLVTVVRADGSRRVVMDESVIGGVERWYDAIIGLTEFAGETVVLELATEWSGAFDPESGLGVWGNPELVADSDAARPNVVLISLDTLRADHLSLYGYPRETSPHIDAWARSGGIVFDDVVASAPWTLPSHVSLFTGLDAPRHGVNHNRPAPNSLNMLAEPLRRAGYATLAVTGGGFVHSSFGFSQGFDQYWSYGVQMGYDDEIEVEIARACAQLERFARRPFFLFFHTYEVHNPFRPRQPHFGAMSNHPDDVMVDVENLPQSADDGYLDHRRLVVQQNGKRVRPLADDEFDLAVDLYDAGIAHTDAMLARVFRRLEHLGIADRTLVVLTSDHGELFGEHGVVNHVSLYEGNLMVPLVIMDPRRRDYRHVEDQVRLVDVAPTVLEIIGQDSLADVDGVSLVPLLEGGRLPDSARFAWSYAAASNYGLSLRDGGLRKYVVRNDPWPHGETSEWLFDLQRDPLEINRLTAPDAEIEPYSDRARRLMEQVMPGIRVRFAGEMSGTIRSEKLFAQRVKTLRPGGGRLQYGPRKEARFVVAAGEEVDLLLEDVGRELTISLETDQPGGRAVDVSVNLADLTGIVVITRDGTGWEEHIGAQPSDDGVSVWWHGPSRGPGPDDSTVDEKLRRQLEALGYVD